MVRRGRPSLPRSGLASSTIRFVSPTVGTGCSPRRALYRPAWLPRGNHKLEHYRKWQATGSALIHCIDGLSAYLRKRQKSLEQDTTETVNPLVVGSNPTAGAISPSKRQPPCSPFGCERI